MVDMVVLISLLDCEISIYRGVCQNPLQRSIFDQTQCGLTSGPLHTELVAYKQSKPLTSVSDLSYQKKKLASSNLH